MLNNILQATPDTAEDFDRLLPLHIQATTVARLQSSLNSLKLSVPVNQFFNDSGDVPTTRVYGFNANGIPTVGPALVSFTSSQELGIPLFYVNGTVTGNPLAVNPNATEVQYVGTQITYTDFLLDIKEPYVRM